MKKVKERVLRPKRYVQVETSVEEKEVFDSSAFDKIEAKDLIAGFKKGYANHVAFLVKHVTDRMSLDTAMVNLEAAVKEHMNGAIVIHEKKVVDDIDNAYELALKMYAYDQAFSFLDDDARKEVLLGLLTRGGGSPLKKGSGGPAGAIAHFDPSQVLADQIRHLEEKLGKKLGHKNASPYSQEEEDGKPKKSKKVGIKAQRRRS